MSLKSDNLQRDVREFNHQLDKDMRRLAANLYDLGCSDSQVVMVVRSFARMRQTVLEAARKHRRQGLIFDEDQHQHPGQAS